jgi:hypothetical protein
VGAHGSLEAVVHRVPPIPDSATSSDTAAMSNGSDSVRLTITLETSPRGARADRSLEGDMLEGRKLEGHQFEVRPLEGTMTTDRGLHGVVEHRLRFPSATASSGTAATGPISIDFVVGLGPSAVLLTDLPLAIGLRGGTYVLASADAPRAE